jgi:FHS family glucose/mannose:H+ symporter-like MFS transporter
MATTLLGPMLPVLSVRWSLTDAAAGALFTAQFAGSLTATTASSVLASRIGGPRAMALGFALIAGGAGALGLVPVSLAPAATVLYGLGLGLVLPLTNNAVAAVAGGNAAAALNLVNVAWGVGAMTWPLVVAAALALDPRVATTTLAVAALVVSALWGSGRFAAATASPAAHTSRVPANTVPRASVTGLYGALILLYVGSETAVSGWASEFARRMPSGGGLWTYAATAFWAAQTTGRLLAPLSIRRIGEGRLLGAGMAVGGLATLALASLAATAAQVIGLSAVIGLALAPVFPLLWARVIRDVAPVQPSALGPLFAAGGVGGAVLPWLVGFVSSGYGLGAGLAVPLSAMALMLVLLATAPASSDTR